MEQRFITLPLTKSGKVQYVPLNEEAKTLLSTFPSWEHSGWVFPSKIQKSRKTKRSHLDSYNFYGRIFRPAVKEANLEGVTWHTLRHTFASRLAMNGQSDSTIAALLRHSGTALVQRYAHLSPTHLRAAVESVASYGKPVTGGPKEVTKNQASDGKGSVGIGSPIATKAKLDEGKIA
jgi:integrase